jgi:hypothetical protein
MKPASVNLYWTLAVAQAITGILLLPNSQQAVRCSWVLSLTVNKIAIVVDDTLSQVDVTGLAVALGIEEAGAEDRNIPVSFKGEVDVLCCVTEVLAVPGEVT